MAARIRQGDEVIVIAGKDKGRRGRVARVFGDGRVVVENINIARKHQKPNPNAGVAGGIIEKEMPLSISNVMVFNPRHPAWRPGGVPQAGGRPQGALPEVERRSPGRLT